MTNLLPEKARSHLMRSYAYRFLSLASFALAALGMLFALSLVPAYMALHAERTALSEEVLVPVAMTDEERVDRTEGARMKATLGGLQIVTSATSSIASAAQTALSLKPAGIFIDRIAFSTHTGLVLAGRSSGREAIQDFRSVLASDSRFAAVSVPVASLLGSEEGRFTMTLTLR